LRAGDLHLIEDSASEEILNALRPIAVGDRVRVGAHASIQKGASIPEDSIVGTRSVVTGTFDQPGVALAGAPARVRRTGIRWWRGPGARKRAKMAQMANAPE